MLTRTQIQRLAQRNHIGMQAQERDYLQHLLLMLLYTRSQALLFKGGTALRLVYRGNRYSEDLDFSTQTAEESAAPAVGLPQLPEVTDRAADMLRRQANLGT